MIDVENSDVAGTLATVVTVALYDDRFEKYAIFTDAF
jgi:hypothetical protein